MRRQDGVVSRCQATVLGMTDNDIERMLRRRVWARVFDGVYVDHTGPLTADQRAWAAVLFAAPSALAGRDALRAHRIRGLDPAPSEPVRIVVAGHRKVAAPPGVRVTRMNAFEDSAQLHLSPPRLRLEPAALIVASEAGTEDSAVAVLADVCQSHRTRPDRLLACLQGFSRLPRRALLGAILRDVVSGTYSALERRYLVQVERAHGLPTGCRQRRVAAGGRVYFRDVTYPRLAANVELDGRLGHEAASDRWADLERDLLAAQSGEITVRVGWLQVLEAHRLAAALGVLFAARGWRARPRACGADCSIRG